MAVAAPALSSSTPFTIEHCRQWIARLKLDNGRSFRLEPFQEAFVRDVLARDDDGRPLFSECWLVVPESNGKTTLIAALALYHLKHTPDAWVTVAASSRDQAKIAYRQAKGFVDRGGAWGFRAFDGYRRVDHREGGGQIEVFAADERTGDGTIPTLAILDELHRHRTLDLYETWAGKLPKRDGQLITISTAGEPGSAFEETRALIRRTAEETERADGFVRAAAAGVILHEYAVDEDADVEDLDAVKTANPFSGVTLESLRKKRIKPTLTLGHWRRFTCNLPTRGNNAAIQEKEWFGAQSDEEIPAGTPIWLGLDLGWRYDTTAAVPLWWRDEHFRLLGPASVLVPPRDETMLDPHLVERALILIHQRTPIHTVIMDMSHGNQLASWIEAELGSVVVDRVQSPALAAKDYELFMEALRNGWLKHSGDQELRTHALNAIARVLPYGDVRFDRPSQTRKGGEQDRRVIDALIAAAMVHSAAAGGKPKRRAVYAF